MKSSKLVLIILAAAGMATSLAGPVAAQSEGPYWRQEISPYAEGPSGRWNEEKQGPRPRGNSGYWVDRPHRNYQQRQYRPRGYFTYRPWRYYQPPAVIYRGRYDPWTPAWYDYCSRKYRSFNPRTGYYLGYDGVYHFCR